MFFMAFYPLTHTYKIVTQLGVGEDRPPREGC